jgi:hypothetical protein
MECAVIFKSGVVASWEDCNIFLFFWSGRLDLPYIDPTVCNVYFRTLSGNLAPIVVDCDISNEKLDKNNESTTSYKSAVSHVTEEIETADNSC